MKKMTALLRKNNKGASMVVAPPSHANSSSL